MTPFGILAISFAASADAFAAALVRGAGSPRSRRRWMGISPALLAALTTGAVFGVIEGLTPVIGYLIGRSAVTWVQAWDHWLAFGILAGLGVLMLREGFKPPEAHVPESPGAEHAAGRKNWKAWIALAAAGFATSIDAMAMGLSLAFVDVNIYVASASIGLVTAAMSFAGHLLGRSLGVHVGLWAERVGGLLLIGVGCHILWSHLHTPPALS